jgi:hypothetical protein
VKTKDFLIATKIYLVGLYQRFFGASLATLRVWYVPMRTALGLAIVLFVIPFTWIIVADCVALSHDSTTIHYANHRNHARGGVKCASRD